MYERSVIVLERYMEDILRLNKPNNLKNNFYTYKEMVEEMRVYQNMLAEEEDVLEKFDEIAKKLQSLQIEQEKIYKNNQILEEQRYTLFIDLDIRPEVLEKKIIRIESLLDKNSDDLKQIRRDYVETLETFVERQKMRNICARKKKGTDANHISTINKSKQLFEMINNDDVKHMKTFIDGDKSLIKEQIFNIMIDNGKSERVPFNEGVIQSAINIRMEIATKEAKCYIVIYDRLRKLLSEIENDNLQLSKYEKTLRDTSVKLKFLKAEKEYIVGFLDNERMTAINGEIIHDKMMQEACKNFKDDINQIDNLYELILKEAASKASKKLYNELYNKTYLKDIVEKEKYFEEEVTSVNISMGTVINSNYWRIEGIKNIYTVFKEEVTEKFERELSDFDDEITKDGYEIVDEEDSFDFNKNKVTFNEDENGIIFNDDEIDKYENETELLEDEFDDDSDIENDGFGYGKEFESDYLKKMQEIEEEKKKSKINTSSNVEKLENFDDEVEDEPIKEEKHEEHRIIIKKPKIKNIETNEKQENKVEKIKETKVKVKRKIRRPALIANSDVVNRNTETMSDITKKRNKRVIFLEKIFKNNRGDKVLKSS